MTSKLSLSFPGLCYRLFVTTMTMGLTLATLQCAKKKEPVKIIGSETMHTMLSVLASNFNKSQSKIEVLVSGGGSKEGIDGLINGTTDIAATSRELNNEENVLLKRKGDLEKITIAYDGIAVVVHPANPVTKLHLIQVSDIFTGKIKNWKEVGGQNEPILLVVRNDKSGTNSYFYDHIIRQKDLGDSAFEKAKALDFDPSAKTVEDNLEMSDYIQSHTNAIGYMGMGAAMVENKTKIKSLSYAKTEKGPFEEPSIKNVHDGIYKLSRALNVLYKSGENPNADAFISYLTGEEGQKFILQSGYLRASLEEVRVEEKR